MKIKNNTSFEVVAVGWNFLKGNGENVHISPGGTAEVKGPPSIGMDDEKLHMCLEGEVTCHESPDDDHGFQVKEGRPVTLGRFSCGVTICHYLDVQSEWYTTKWRRLAPV